MRILLIANDFPNPYEPAKGIFNLYLAHALAKRHEVQVISPISWLERWKVKTSGVVQPRNDFAVLDGISVHYPRYFYPPKLARSSYGWCLWQSIRGTVWRVLDSYVPDAVVGYWAHPDGHVANRVAKAIGIPSAVIVGGSDVLLLPRNHRRRRCVVNVLTATDAVLAVSRDLQANTVKLGIPEQKVHLWSQGVDTDLFSPGDRAEARRRLGVPVEGKALLWVGRMHPVKAVDVLVEACAKLQNKGADFRLYLVGDGPLRQALEAQVRAASLSEKVCFVGPQDHRRLADWYRATDLTVLPSLSEGIPNTLRESLACGTPFVASRVGGIPEIAEEPANWLVPPGDSTALADAIQQALDNSGTRTGARPQSAGWSESASALVEILRPLVEKSQDHDQPWWAGKPRATIKATTRVNPFRLRQLIRKAMATLLPKRMFLVHGRRQADSVSLTFDDGPHPEYTPHLLDILKGHGVKASFFVVGRQAKLYPDLVRRIAAEGHDVANHSYFHSYMEQLSAGEAVQGILKTQKLLRQLAGNVPSVYRPPHGKLTLWKLLRLWWAGLSVILWNVDARDYAWEDAADLAEWIRRNPLHAGDIVLFHDRLPLAGQVLPELIETTRQRGLSFVPVSQWAR
jgi:teichuronic acid biosynthesis glycosyltransferase TuaC